MQSESPRRASDSESEQHKSRAPAADPELIRAIVSTYLGADGKVLSGVKVPREVRPHLDAITAQRSTSKNLRASNIGKRLADKQAYIPLVRSHRDLAGWIWLLVWAIIGGVLASVFVGFLLLLVQALRQS